MPKLIGYHGYIKNGKGFLINNYGDVCREPSYFGWLLEDHLEEEGHRKVVYDLDGFVAVFCRLIDFTEQEAEILLTKGKFHTPPWDITYYPGKYFSVAKGNGYNRPYIGIYNMEQYLDGPRIEDNPSVEYARGKAQEARDIGSRVSHIYHDLGWDGSTLTSPIGSLEKSVLKGLSLPNHKDVPEGANDLAIKCCKGPWVEAFQVGYWPEAFDYDLACYSDDTECLTFDGWKRIIDVVQGELVLGFDQVTNKCRFQSVREVHKYDYSGPMVDVLSRKIDLCITPNHRVLLQIKERQENSKFYREHGYYGYDGWQVKEAGRLPKGNFRFPISFPMEDKLDYNIPDEVLRLIAWINTEGYVLYSLNKQGRKPISITITQSEASPANIQHCVEIESDLQSVGRPYRHKKRERLYSHLIKAGINKAVYKDQVDHLFTINLRSWAEILRLEEDIHIIPLWVLQNCSLRQLQIFYDTLMKGDGGRSKSTSGEYYTKAAFYTKLAVNADRMMYLCQLLGYKVSMVNPDKSHVTYRVYIIEEQRRERNNPYCEDVQFGSKHVVKTTYNGVVCCLTVDDGFIVVRRNGKSCICGNSAYPHILSQLLDLRRGDWVLSPERPEGAVYGFMDGMLTIDAPFTPLLYNPDNTDESTTSPTGTRPEQITMDEYDFIYAYKQGTFDIQLGWWWIPNASIRYEPLKGIVNWLYEQRQKHGSDPLTNKLIKRAMAGQWGKLLSVWSDGQYSPTFNPVWAAIVESRTKLAVARFVLDNKLTPIHIAVDGVIAPQKVKVPKDGGMGTWHMSHTGGVLVLSSGVAAVEGKVGAEDFSLKYDWLKAQIDNNPEATEFEMIKPSICTLTNALVTNFDKLGEVENITKTIKVQVDNKRMYWDTPEKAGDLLENQYDSEPIDIATILGQGVQG